MFTKEQIKEIEDMGMVIHFHTVVESGFKRGTFSKDDNRLADLYEAATGTVVKRNFSCKVCCFNFYKDCGKLYFESKKYWEEQEAGDEIVEMIQEMVTPPKTPKKKITKTKTNKKK